MRMKRMSNALEKAEQRAESLSSIEEDLDLGNGLTLETYWEEIAKVRALQKRYNARLSGIDQIYNELQTEEKVLMEMSDHMLSGVKVKFGRDSSEYEMAGGVRHSERKRPKRKEKVMASEG
jgi:DNA repair ATPase RecN